MNCGICFEKFNYDLNKPCSLYPCGHTFCKQCLKTITNNTCSKCKKTIVFKQTNYAVLEILNELNDEINNDKMNVKLDQIDLTKEVFLQRINDCESLKMEKIKQFTSEIKTLIDDSQYYLKQKNEKLIQDVNLISMSLTTRLNNLKENLNQIKLKQDNIRNHLSYDKLDMNTIFKELKSIETSLDLKKIENIYSKFEEQIDSINLNQLSVKNIEAQLYLTNEISENYYNEANELYYDARNRSKALDLIDKVIALKPNCAKAYCLKGKLLFVLNKNNEALKCFNKSIEIDSNYVMAYNSKSIIVALQSNNEEAAKLVQTALDLNRNPQTQFDYINKAFSLTCLNRTEDALDYITKAIELDPKNGFAYFLKSYNVSLLNKNLESIHLLDITIELMPNYDMAYNNKGFDYSILKDFNKALEFYNIALDLNPNLLRAFANKVKLFEKLNKHDEIIKTVDKFIQMNPDQIFVYAYKIKALSKLDKIKDALNLCFNLLKREKSVSETYKYCLNFIIDNNKFEEALYYCNKACYLDCEDEMIIVLKLKSLNGLKKFDESLKLADKYLLENKSNVIVYQCKGEAFLGLNNKTEACDCFRKAIELDPDNIDLNQLLNKSEK